MVVRLAEADLTDRVMHALADSTRRDIVATVLTTEHSVSALARKYPMTFAAIQKHVAVLEAAHLVTKRVSGRERLVSGNMEALRTARAVFDQLESLWRDRAMRMHDLLDDESPAPSTTYSDRADRSTGHTSTRSTPDTYEGERDAND